MSLLETGRYKLPLLAVSQAQKEITHNEALVRIDALLHAVAQEERAEPPILSDEDIGKCWLVSNAAANEWAGKSGHLAIWIGGGWRFCAATEGMRVRMQPSGVDWVRMGSQWISAPNITEPNGGTMIDQEARQAITSLLVHLRSIGTLTI
jgi:Protein of unknown function (DUF2793)